MIDDVDEERSKKAADDLNNLMQRWIDNGSTLTEILYVLGSALTALLGQAGAPRNKIEKLRGDILNWINSTDGSSDHSSMNRAQRRAMKKTKH